MTHLLGLTGSIGMGKSTTAQMFQDNGVPVWDADAVVHRLYARGGGAVSPMSAVFPEAIVDDAVSRQALKDIIAADPQALTRIEQIVHPLVAQNRDAFRENYDGPLVVFDIPLLFETGADAWLSSVLVVSVPYAIQKERVLSRAGMTAAQFDTILSHQMPDAEKCARADHIIETINLDDTNAAVRELIDTLSGPENA